jgi:Tfp pilus assembly PilM family ATPase
MIWLPKVAGVEIGSSTVKIAIVRKGLTGRGARVLTLVEKQIVQHDNESRNAAVVRALHDGLQQLGESPDVYVSHVPGRNAVVRVLSVPFTNMRLVASTIKGDLEPHVPMPIDDLVADFSPINATDGKTSVLTVAVRKSSLRDHLETLSEVDIDPEIVDLDFASITALWLRENAVREHELTVLVHALADASLLVVMEGRKMIFLRGMDFSAEDLRNDTQHAAEQVLTTIRVFAAGSRRRTDIDGLVFTGTRLSAEQCTELERTLGQSVSVCQLGDRLTLPQDMAEHDAGAWAAVIGSALNYAGRSRIGFNFRKEEFARHGAIASIKKHAAFTGSLVVLLVLASFGYLQSRLHSLTAETKSLESAMVELYENTFNEKVVRADKALELMTAETGPMKKMQEEHKMYRPYLAGTTSTLDLLHEIITLIPDSSDLVVKKLSMSGGIVSVRGQAADANKVTLVEQQLGNSGLLRNVDVAEQATNKNNNKIDFTISAQRL